MFKKMLLCGFIAIVGASVVVPHAAQAAVQQLPGETISFDLPVVEALVLVTNVQQVARINKSINYGSR